MTVSAFREHPTAALEASKAGPLTITSRGRPVARLVTIDPESAPREQDARQLCGVLTQYVKRGPVSVAEKREAIEHEVSQRYLTRR